MALTLFVAALLLGGCIESEEVPLPEMQKIGHVERYDARLDALVDSSAQFEVLAEGYEWAEGPVWVPDGGFLLFSDVPANRVYRWKAGEGARVFLEPSGYTGEAAHDGEGGSNGLALDADGRLLLAQHGDRRLARLDAPLDDPAPRFTTLADRYDGRRFNSPNDLAFHPGGALYFTDPPYGLAGGPDDPTRELPFQGVFRLDPDGTVALAVDSLSRPNGLAFAPDGRTLYVANSDPERAYWAAYDVRADGSLAAGRIFYDATPRVQEGRAGLPDGLKIDRAGHLFATGPGGVLVFHADGTLLGTLVTTRATANVAFGEDGTALFATADDLLLRLPLTTTGLGF